MMHLNTAPNIVSNFWKCPQVENEAAPEEETKEESDEEDEEDEESGRIRFKSERKDGAVVRLADAGSNRRNIPETLGTNYSNCELILVFYTKFFQTVHVLCFPFHQNCQRKQSKIWWNSRNKNGKRNKTGTEAEGCEGACEEAEEEEEASRLLEWWILEETEEEWTTSGLPWWACR